MLNLITRGLQIQRTPIVNRTTGAPFAPQQNTAWAQPQHVQGQPPPRNQAQRQPFGAVPDRHFRSNSASDRSDSANEVENMLINNRPPARRTSDQGGWTTTGQRARPTQQRSTLIVYTLHTLIHQSASLRSNDNETNVEWIQTGQIVVPLEVFLKLSLLYQNACVQSHC